MKRIESLWTVAVCGAVFFQVSAATAGDKHSHSQGHKNNGSNNSNRHGNSNNRKGIGRQVVEQKLQKWNVGKGQQSGRGITSQPFPKNNKHTKSEPNLTKITDPVNKSVPSQPQGQPGYIYVNGHWQRTRASGANPGSKSVPTNVSQPVVRDHRIPVPPTVFPTPGGKQRDHAITGQGLGLAWPEWPGFTTNPGSVPRDVVDHRSAKTYSNGRPRYHYPIEWKPSEGGK